MLVFDMDVWEFLPEVGDAGFSFVFCSLDSWCSCSRILVTMIKQSSQRVKPYLSKSNFFVFLQMSHFPVLVPIRRTFLEWAVYLVSSGCFAIRSHLSFEF